MKFNKSQIAALVLGYLKSEKLTTVVEEFIKCSSYLTENNQNIKIGKYFVTRVGGLSLVDFLEEYAMIYSIIQGRLEETNYFENHNRTSLVDQLLFLLDKEQEVILSSTPISTSNNEIEATPAHSLPGNTPPESQESCNSITRTPKKRCSRSRSRDRGEVIDEMTEVLTQSLLEHHELHEKIAETINNVRNAPEVTKPLTDEHISAGASKELDAVIKTVIQRTEVDPIYNKFIDEIIGTTTSENSQKKLPDENVIETPKTKPDESIKNSTNVPDPMTAHNNEAIQSIIQASQNNEANNENGEVIVFDGNFDSYLKASGATTTVNQNSVYLNQGMIVVPPVETQKQFYIVNNQPLLKMNLLTEKELMSIPTIIVNDDNESLPTTTTTSKKPLKRVRHIKPKPVETVTSFVEVSTVHETKETLIDSKPITEPLTVVVTASETISSVTALTTVTTTTTTTSTARQASHIRNLNFTTPSINKTKSGKAWDADLRQLVQGCKDKSPSPKRKRQLLNKKKKKQSKDNEEAKTEDEDVKDCEIEERELPKTPLKNEILEIPKTPGVSVGETLHCTPFNDVLEEQLKGVDLNSIPTPNIPITPGFALTPGDGIQGNQRMTDYSASSSYYQPSDTEQPKSLDELVQETSMDDTKHSDKFTNLKILSDVVISQGKVTKKPGKKINNNTIAKKNLSLIRPEFLSSTSDSDSDVEDEKIDNTVICLNQSPNTRAKVSSIKSIIGKCDVKKTLDDKTDKKDLLLHLEEVRKRTVQKIKNAPEAKKTRGKYIRKPKVAKPIKKRGPKKKEKEEEPVIVKDKKETVSVENKKETVVNEIEKDSVVVENKEAVTVEKESQNLVNDLAERGIHLIPNQAKEESAAVENDDSIITFDVKVYDECENVVHGEYDGKRLKKSYNFEVLKKSMSAKVFIEDSEEEVVRLIKWTDCDCLLNFEHIVSPRRTKRIPQQVYDELMDFVFVGAKQASPEKQTTKGGKKRKSKMSDNEGKQSEKRNKLYESPIKLLKNIDVEDFLDKVHGE